MKRIVLCMLLLAGTAHAEAVISLPETFETSIYAWRPFEIPVYISDFTNPTGLGAKWVEVNLLCSPGISIYPGVIVGPWTISGNPTGYYGWYNTYVDLWQMRASWINSDTAVPGCITQPMGIAFSLLAYRNSQWSGSETITFGRSIKEAGPEPRLYDCGLNLVPIRYGNTVCTITFPAGSGEEEGGCCQEPPVTTTLEGDGPRPILAKQPTTWGRLKAMYR